MVQARGGKGHGQAQYNLGCLFDTGEGVKQDKAEAVRWYTLAAEQGRIDAQFNLAVSFEDGEGVKRDFDAARHWFSKAAMQGDEIARKAAEELTQRIQNAHHRLLLVAAALEPKVGDVRVPLRRRF